MYITAFPFIFLTLLLTTRGEVVAKVDAFNQLILLQRFFYTNFVGVTMPYQNVYKDLNKTLFQQYFQNSKMYNHSQNLWTASLKMPFGWKYQCDIYKTAQIPYVSCDQQLKNNKTLFDQLAYFAMNATNIPLWSIGYDYQFLDAFDSKKTNSMQAMLNYIYDKTNNNQFGINFVNEGDIAVQNGYYLDHFTPDDFFQLAYYIQYVFFGLAWTGPGVTMAPNYTDDWVQYCLTFYQQMFVGIYTFNLVIFESSSQATIDNLLSQNYTKGFLKKRFGNITNFGFYDSFKSVAIYQCKLMEGPGVDGITNSFASIIWFIDFCFELAMYDPVGISMAMELFSQNYQAVLQPGPYYKPKALYYGLLFMSLLIDGGTQIGKPGVMAGTSTKFKVWVLHTLVEPYRVKLIFLNKDMNSSLNGTVRVNIVETNRLSCMYLQSQYLNSTDGFKFAGYHFEGNNSQQIGEFEYTQVSRDLDTYFYVPIKYGQIVYCEGNYSIDIFPQGPNPSVISTNLSYSSKEVINYILLLLFVLSF